MRKREEIEKEVCCDSDYSFSVELNQALIIEILLDIRESVNPPSIKLDAEILEKKED